MDLPNVEWLLRKATSEGALNAGLRTKVDDERWRAVIEQVEIGEGLRVFLVSAEVRQPITIDPEYNETEPWMAASLSVAGRVRVVMPDGAEIHIQPDHAAFYRPSARYVRIVVPGGQVLRYSGFVLRGDRIERLFGGNVPAVLRPLIAPGVTESRITTMRSTSGLRALGKSLFAPGLSGRLRTLAIEGAVFQLLASMVAACGAAAEAPQRRGAFTRAERQCLMEAHDRLLADMRQPPTLGELASQVGLTERRLNAGFRALFGVSVFEMLRCERLERAVIALEEGSLSVKQVAHRVGYNHVTNFINAFTARYGVPPRAYRANLLHRRGR